MLADVAAWIGGWAEVAPRSFYLSFPGFGRNWIVPLGPYNEHLLRDFGGLNLGLAAAAVVAAVALTRSAAICAAAAWLVYSVPHLVFHALHTGSFTGIDNAATLASLAAPMKYAGQLERLPLTAQPASLPWRRQGMPIR